MGEERREPEGREEPEESEAHEAPEGRRSVSITIVQHNPVIIGGRYWATRDRGGGWI